MVELALVVVAVESRVVMQEMMGELPPAKFREELLQIGGVGPAVAARRSDRQPRRMPKLMSSVAQ